MTVNGTLILSGKPLDQQKVDFELQLRNEKLYQSTIETKKNGSFSLSLEIPEKLLKSSEKADLIFYYTNNNTKFQAKVLIDTRIKKIEIEDLEMRTTNTYIISTGKPDQERITILNRCHNPDSIKFLKLEAGMNVLTVGCGIGILEQEIADYVGDNGKVFATDKNRDQLIIAKQNPKKDNLEFSQLDLNFLDYLQKQYDRVHCRFVLSHIPWKDIENILPRMLKVLAPGGALVLEEITTLDSLSCVNKQHKGYDVWKKLFYKQFEAQKSDPHPGKRILEYFQNEKNCTVIHNTYQPALQGSDKKILRLGILALEDKLLNQTNIKKEEVEEWKRLLEDLEKDDSIIPKHVEVTQLFITKK